VSLAGNMQMKNCDPNQSQWCVGETELKKHFVSGQYILTTKVPAVCQNVGSEGNGFIVIKGCSVCKPGTNRNPFDEDACITNIQMGPPSNTQDIEPIEPVPGVDLTPLRPNQ